MVPGHPPVTVSIAVPPPPEIVWVEFEKAATGIPFRGCSTGLLAGGHWVIDMLQHLGNPSTNTYKQQGGGGGGP